MGYLVFNATLNNISLTYMVTVSFIGWENLRTWKKNWTCYQSLTNYCINLYWVHLLMVGIWQKTLAVTVFWFDDFRVWVWKSYSEFYSCSAWDCMVYTALYIILEKNYNWCYMKNSETCLNWTSLGPSCLFRIDRCLDYPGYFE